MNDKFIATALGWLLSAIAGLVVYLAVRSLGLTTAVISAAIVAALIEEILRYVWQTRRTPNQQ